MLCRIDTLRPRLSRPFSVGIVKVTVHRIERGDVVRKQLTGRPANVYREAVSTTFEQLCRLTGLSNIALARELCVRLGRESLARQTLRAWRSGEQPVPGEAFLAVVELAGASAAGPLMTAFEDQFVRSVDGHSPSPRSRQL